MKLNKDPILEQDLVLIYIEEKPAFYARVENITADVKPKWWQVQFLILSIPAQLATWIIDDEQIRGADFTMGGTPIRIEKVRMPDITEHTGEDRKRSEKSAPEQEKKQKARVLSLSDRNKNIKS